jgi:hypothetical protein
MGKAKLCGRVLQPCTPPPFYPRPPLIDELVGILSVSRVTAGAHCHVLVGALNNFLLLTPKFLVVENFAKISRPKTHTRNFPEIFDPTTWPPTISRKF